MSEAELRDALVAGGVAAALSGAPSTLYALATGDNPLEGILAAGTMVLPDEDRTLPLVLAATPAHIAISLGWAVVLSALLPRRDTAAYGALAGLAIAALDLGVLGRRFPRIRGLPVIPQVADHLAYGAVVGAVLGRRRGRRA